MRSSILSLLFLLPAFCHAQGYNFSCTKDTTVIGCAGSCIELKTVLPYLRGSSTTYIINNVNPSGSCFLPPVEANDVGGASANITIDDRYSSVIGIGFPFSFFGTNYTQL